MEVEQQGAMEVKQQGAMEVEQQGDTLQTYL
jgi:hypothetical protein